MRKFGPKSEDYQSVENKCPACGNPLGVCGKPDEAEIPGE